ncbi:MAG: hypothetical protein IJ475_02695 [Bacilli bacterium]|nr:hypothetical protein [Bacilli bacterium]
MLKDLRNTVIFVAVGFVIIFIGFFFYINFKGNDKIKIEELSLDDDIVLALNERLLLSDQFRDSYESGAVIDNYVLLTYLFDNIKDGDYTTQTIKNKKIVCKVTNDISFTSSSKCEVIQISNNKINEIKLKLLNHSQEVVFSDFEYKGFTCKNDGENYYCLMNAYVSTTNDYSVLENAFKRDGKVVIQDYYLSIDIADFDVCSSYYTKEYCENYMSASKPVLDDSVIKDKGVLYELTFVFGEFGYYLESIEII